MRARLTIDLEAIADNWRALEAMTACETAAVVKADAYGLGAAAVGPALATAGAKTFFVALADEGVALREALGPGPRIFVFSGLMKGEGEAFLAHDLIPLLNSPGQVAAARALAKSAGRALAAGFQVDSGMNRLGMEMAEIDALVAAPDWAEGLAPELVMSHLACADEPEHPQNAAQLAAFEAARRRLAPDLPASLAATGGVLLGGDYHFDLTRPGVGLYGGLPFRDAGPVARLIAPIIQVRDVSAGEAVGYGAGWTAERPSRIGTIAVGYADGLIRAMGGAGFPVRLGAQVVPTVGRVSMDLITIDLTSAPSAAEGDMVEILGLQQSVDDLAGFAGTIGYEILTSLGARYERRYVGDPAGE